MKMDVNYFIAKFEAIPEKKWGMYAYQNEDNTRCALGHCATSFLDAHKRKRITSLLSVNCVNNPEVINLIELFGSHGLNIPVINDGESILYQQDTPKQRILAALRDIQTKQEQEKAVEETNKILAEPIKLEECL